MKEKFVPIAHLVLAHVRPNHVVPGDGHEGDGGGVVADLELFSAWEGRVKNIFYGFRETKIITQ